MKLREYRARAPHPEVTCASARILDLLSSYASKQMRIQNHKLAWRWTDPKYAVLPSEVLAKMIPIPPKEAGEQFVRSLSMLGKDALADSLAQRKIATERLEPSAGSAWLREMQPDQDQVVVLSWDNELAIRTNWGIFVAYWPEFCYPASDDLVVFPESEEWVLLYHHEEEFHFGTRSVA